MKGYLSLLAKPFFLGSLLALNVISPSVLASDWTINQEQSHIHFISIKKGDIAEVHQFNEMQGTFNESGDFSLSIPLSSVNTGIEIRDERMQTLLFEVAQFPTLSLTAKVNPKLVDELKVGEVLATKVEGQLSLHGQQQTIVFEVAVVKLTKNKIQVNSSKPLIVSAADFSLAQGVEKLRDIAGLSSISLAVPVSFMLTLSK